MALFILTRHHIDELLKLNQIIFKNSKIKNPQITGDYLKPSAVIKKTDWLRGWDSNPRPSD